jgi:hypothetical protein
MCFDSPDPPKPPDYGPMAAASEKAAEYSYKISKEQLDWAKKTYGDNKLVSDKVIAKAMSWMDTQEKWAKADRSRYETIFQPLEADLAKEAKDYASAGRMQAEAGKAEADVAAQFHQARQAAQDRLEAYGVDPSQTRAGALDLSSRVAEAAAQASAGNQARTQTENIGRALREQAINVGKGYPAQVQAAAAGSGASGNQAVNTGLATTTSGAQTMGSPGQWQGLGNQSIGQWGQTLNQGYSNALSAYNAEQQNSTGIGDILGLATSFLPFFADGGAIPEDPSAEGQYLDPAMSPSGGAIPDDIDAEIAGGPPAKLNAGEFIVPKDVVGWLGEKGMQQLILKARKEMTGANGERPAQPEVAGQPPPQQQQLAYDSVGAIPSPPV